MKPGSPPAERTVFLSIAVVRAGLDLDLPPPSEASIEQRVCKRGPPRSRRLHGGHCALSGSRDLRARLLSGRPTVDICSERATEAAQSRCDLRKSLRI